MITPIADLPRVDRPVVFERPTFLRSPSPAEQNQRLAEFCGWTETYLQISGGARGVAPGDTCHSSVPDYFHDLNAVRMAVLRLTNEQFNEYRVQLALRVGIDLQQHMAAEPHDCCVALLKVVGRWHA